MSDRNDGFRPERTAERAPDLARIAVAQARKRMMAAAAQPIAVKWRSMRRGDRVGAGTREAAARERPPG
jgi:hypothetical protein